MLARLTLMASAAAILMPFDVEAQEAGGDEIIVTAQKRAQSLQDVSVSVQVVPDDDLEARNFNQVEELSRLAPGFTVADSTSDPGRSLAVRGVGTQTFSRAVDQSVGLVVDGVVATSTAASLLDLSDIERIEVLRGPQGMLFGKNASAGLLNIATKNPTAQYEIGAGATFAGGGERKIDAHISGPIAGETLMGRVSFYRNKRDALVENVHPAFPDLNDRDEWGVRAKLLFEPSDGFSALFTYTHAERDHLCCIAPVVINTGPFPIPAGPKNTQVNSFGSAPGTTRSDAYALELNYDLGAVTLTSISAYNDDGSSSAVRSFGLPIEVILENDGADIIDQFTQELRVTSESGGIFEYVAGVYYFKRNVERDFQRVINGAFLGAPANLSEVLDVEAESESIAIFGQGTLHVTNSTRILAGLRVNRDEVAVNQEFDFLSGTLPGVPPSALGMRQESLKDTAASWRFTLEQDAGEDVLLFASAARGYKGPAGNTLPGAVAAPEMVIAPEIPTSYEIGIKSQLFDKRLTLNADVFYTEFKDFQTSVADFTSIPVSFFLDNAGELETKGFELEFVARPFEGFTLNGAAAYVDATFKEFLGAACYPGQTPAEGCVGGVQDLSGKELPNSPDWTLSATARYAFPLGFAPADAHLQASYYYQGATQSMATNNPLTVAPSYDLLDLAAGLTSSDGKLAVQVFVKNVFDDFYTASLSDGAAQFGAPLSHFLNYDYKRRIGVSLRVNI